MDHAAHGHPYRRFWLMIGLSFLAMYAFTYSMVDRWDNVYPSLTKAYMAGLMTAPMLVLEMLLMAKMYPNRQANRAIVAAGVLAMAVLWLALRQEWGVGDRNFLRSMIPHHAAALLMCQQAPITRPDLRELCGRIIAGQQREINEMKAMLASDAPVPVQSQRLTLR